MISVSKDIFRMFDKSTKNQFLILLLLMFVSALLEAISIGLVLPVLTFISQSNFNKDNIFFNFASNLFEDVQSSDLVLISIIIFVVVYLFKTLFLIFFNWIKNRYIYGWKVDLSQRVFKKYLSLPYDFFLKNNSAIMFRNANVEVDHCVGIVSNFLSLILEIFLICFLLSLLILIDFRITVQVFLILGFIGVCLYFLTRKKLKNLGLSRVLTEKYKVQYLKQGLNGVKDVKIYDKANEFLSKFYKVNKINQKSYETFLFLQSLPRLILEFSAVFLLGFFALYLNTNKFSLENLIPVLGVFVVASLRIMPSIGKIASFYQSIIFQRPSLNTISNVFTHKESSKDNEEEKNNINFDFNNNIVIKNVFFKYLNENSPVLNDISFEIKKGDYVGLIGKSGSGKSTLADIILGLLYPNEGQILVDNKNINTNLKSWQKKIGYVPQTVYFTDDTLESNIAFGLPEEKIDRKKLSEAIDKAQLIDLIKKIPNGTKTMMGEFGHNLSGGERQRIGIARAYYNDPEIIFFDEATVSLDFETEKNIFETILNLKNKKTIIVVTHKTELLSDANKIIKLENGKISTK